MDSLLKLTVRGLVVKAVSLSLAGIILVLVERALLGCDAAMPQIPLVVGTATLFFAMSLPASTIYLRIMRNGGKQAMGFYILQKGIRLMLAIAVVIFCAFASHDNLIAFAPNLIVLYIVEMGTTDIYYHKMERIMKLKQ